MSRLTIIDAPSILGLRSTGGEDLPEAFLSMATCMSQG